MQSRIQEFLHKEMKPNAVDLDHSVSNIVASAAPKMDRQASGSGSSSYLKKAKPLSNASLPVMLKNTSAISSMQKGFERQRNIKKPKSEDKMVVLKPVEIVLPPVMRPFFNPQGNRSQIASNHYYYRWIGAKSGFLSPSTSKKLIKSKELSSSSTTKHSRPLL